MAEPISIQQLKDASEDAITLADFIYKPANVMIPRRLAADINSLQYYLDYMSSYAQHSYETYDEMVTNAVNLSENVSVFVTNDLDTSKNGIYTYNGVSFVKGDYQPEKVAKDYVDAKLGGLEVFDGKVRAQDVSTADGSTQDVKNTEFRTELDTLPEFINGKLSDSVVSIMRYGIERTQEEKNREALTPFDFGAIGDGTYHPLSERYATLALAQAQYPHVTELTDSIDWAALQAFFNYCHVNKVTNAVASCNAFINKPLNYTGALHETNLIYGDLKLKTEQAIDYMLHLTGALFNFKGTITLHGASGNANALKTRHGLLIGKHSIHPLEGNSAFSPNLHIDKVSVANTYDTGVFFGDLTHFASIDEIRGDRIGSCFISSSVLSNTAVFTSATSVAGDVYQSSTLSVDKVPYAFTGTAFAYIDNYMYQILSFDATAKTITIYPRIPSAMQTGNISYQQGSVVSTHGGDCSNLRVGTLQSFTSGIAADLRALYGVSITTFVTESNGVAVSLGARFATTVGNNINSGYFEGNIVDIMYVWGSSGARLPIKTTIGLQLEKIKTLYSFRGTVSDTITANGTATTSDNINIAGLDYNAQMHTASGELTHPATVHHLSFWGNYALEISLDPTKAILFNKRSSVFVFSGAYGIEPSGVITLTPKVGTINGMANFTVDAAKYKRKSIAVYVFARSDTEFSATVLTPENLNNGGTTAGRPVGAVLGSQYFDTTLNKLIVWNGSAWVDVSGTAV